jgi:hypothetical protein
MSQRRIQTLPIASTTIAIRKAPVVRFAKRKWLNILASSKPFKIHGHGKCRWNLMKTRLHTLAAIGLVGGIILSACSASGRLEVSVGVEVRAVSDFYHPLSGCGTWIEVGSYGRCWRPVGVGVEWWPYCDGYWVWTDAGWYWVSDEPWAWACYHYGTWAYDSEIGWFWVPDVEWAPAWVYWRMGGSYIGWAPCGPRGFVIEPTYYVFVESRRFHDHIVRKAVTINNLTIIERTKSIKNLHREQKQIDGQSRTVIVNDGPSVQTIEQATGLKYSATPVSTADRKAFAAIPKAMKQKSARPAPGVNAPEQKGPGGGEIAPKGPYQRPPDKRPVTPPDTDAPHRARPGGPPGGPEIHPPHPSNPAEQPESSHPEGKQNKKEKEHGRGH